MKKFKFKWPAKGKFSGLGKKIFSWLPFFVACGFTLFAAVFFIVPAEDVEAASLTKTVTISIKLPFDFNAKKGTCGCTVTAINGSQFGTKSVVGTDGYAYFEYTASETKSNANLYDLKLDHHVKLYIEDETIACNSVTFENPTGSNNHITKDILYDETEKKHYISFSLRSNDSNLSVYKITLLASVVWRNCTITGQDQISKDALDYFCWNDNHANQYEASQGSMTVPFWLASNANFQPSKGAKLFIDPKYTLEYATVVVTVWNTEYKFYGAKKHKEIYGDEAVRDFIGVGVADYYVQFPTEGSLSLNEFTSVKISGVTHRQSPQHVQRFVRQPDGDTIMPDYAALSLYSTDEIIIMPVHEGAPYNTQLDLLEFSYVLSPHHDFSSAKFSCYNAALLDDTLPMESRFTEAAKLDDRLYDQENKSRYITFKHAVKDGTSGYNLEYDGYGSDTTVVVVISGVIKLSPIFKGISVDCSDLKGNSYLDTLSIPCNRVPIDVCGEMGLTAEFTDQKEPEAYFYFNSPYEFTCESKLSQPLYDVSGYTINLYSDASFSTPISNTYYTATKNGTTGLYTLTFSTNKYHGDVYILVSGITFKFYDFSISQDPGVKGIKSTTYQQFEIAEVGSWAQTDGTDDPVTIAGTTTASSNALPEKHAFEFDINFTECYQYNMEKLGYMFSIPYTCKADDTNAKINDVLSIKSTGTNTAITTYTFTFYDNCLHISIPEGVIDSNIAVTIKQSPEQFVNCINSFIFESNEIKSNVSVHNVHIQSQLDNPENVIAVVGAEIEYEYDSVINSEAHYYAVKLRENESEGGYDYVFDNFGAYSSRGAVIKILKGEDLKKIGLEDGSYVKYISVYLDDPAATEHIINFTGICTARKTVEITFSEGIKAMKDDSFVGAINPIFSDSESDKKWTMDVYHGQYLNFTVVPEEDYYLDRSDVLSISSEGNSYDFQLNESGSNIGVLIHNIKGDLTVNITAQKAPLSITFENVEGLKYYSCSVDDSGNIGGIGDQLFGVIDVEVDSTYCFAVKAENGYNLETVALKNYDSNLESTSDPNSDYKYYKLENIQQYAKISGTIDKSTYTIKFVKDAYNTTSGSEESKAVITYTQDGEQISNLTIVHGESVSFEVGLEDRFSNSKIKVYSKWDDGSAEEIFASDGIYTLSNIMHNCEVYVEGVELNQYIINFVENDKVQYELDGKVKASDAILLKHGEDYTFKLIPKKGYQITDKTIVNQRTVEGTTSLKPTSAGNYTISNILQDCTITVENAEDIIYKISFKNQDGVTYRNRDGDVISKNLSIKYGENFEFAVELDDAYDDSIQGMKPIANDDKSISSRVNKLAEGKYLIPNVIEDIELEVLNVRKNRYTVNLIKMEGVDFHNSNGKVITGPNEVEHGESLNFKVYVYPAYDGSKLKVMLGDNPLAAQTAGDYLVEGVTENKTVTVIGVEESLVTRLINTINNLPNPISDLDDVDKVIEASKMYQLIPADQRHLVTNISVLNSLQDQSKAFHHVNNGVTVEGISWRIKLVAVPVSSSTEACSRIYKKLDSEYVLSLYDVYFWDTVNEVRYKPAKEQTITLTLPKPDLKYFENATGVCGDAKGDVDFLSLTSSGDSVHLNINSPGYIGVVADRTSTPGRSSLLDAADANWETLTNALSSFGIGSSKEDASQGTQIFNDTENDSDANDIIQEGTGNISEKYKSRNNKVTAQGSAIRLVLVLMIVILVAVIVWVIVKKRKERKEMDN